MFPPHHKAAFHPAMAPMKPIYERGDMAIIHGAGDLDVLRSHFRSMDIGRTPEPNKLGTEGWLGRATLGVDRSPQRKLARCSPPSASGRRCSERCTLPGVPVACVDNLDN